MKRKITEKLINWKNKENRKPLIVRGARQVGKTWSITDFGNSEFSGNVHIINFEKNPEIHSVFDLNLDTKRIIAELEIILNKRIIPENDLLFFDEIQDCPKAIMSLRYFYEQNPNLHIIAAGSLLEFALQDISFPVGRLQMISMHPMTFEEFLTATGKDLIADKIKQSCEPLQANIIELINNELYKYFIVGGMPECVKTFAKMGSFLEVKEIQTDLIAAFRQDFSKYAGHSDKRCLNSVLSMTAKKTGEQIKYSHLSNDFSNPTIKKAFELLETARLFAKIKAASPSGLPLNASASEKKFKAIFLDIGLLSNINEINMQQLKSDKKMFAGFSGKPAEQFVGQEMLASGREELFYWSRNARGSSAETDYIIEKDGEIIPIEVKSGKSGSIKSLHLLLNTFPNIKSAVVFTKDKYGEITDKKLKFSPLFCAATL